MMPSVKPYRSVVIRECGEPLVPIPLEFAFKVPHPYEALGAPYGLASPWVLRASVLEALMRAQKRLTETKPGWKIFLFDAYRPRAVQQFMVEHEFRRRVRAAGYDPQSLSTDEVNNFMEQSLRIFAIPSDDPKTPPPHSTGAVIDCTLCDARGDELDMGSPIDENSDRSLPDYFATTTDLKSQDYHRNRVFLHALLAAEGFWRHPTEWWHFSQGDQLAVWLEYGLAEGAYAIYGGADFIPKAPVILP